MRKRKDRELSLTGGQLMARGDVITMLDGDTPVKCMVLSCVGNNEGSCLATVEFLEGPKKGSRISATLRAGEKQ